MNWRRVSWGPEQAPAVLALHGFAGVAEAWAPVAAACPDIRLEAVDLPGHGSTPLVETDWRLAEAADALAAAMADWFAGPVPVIGYSLGGRLALHLAVRHPGRVASLGLVGVSAGLASERERAERLAQDETWVRLLREQGLEAFLAVWSQLPLFATQQALAPERQAWWRACRAGLEPEGLARAMQAFSLGAQPPLHDALAGLPMPVSWIVGEHDAKFLALASELAPRCPRATLSVVAGCGHNVPLEAPGALAALIPALIPTPAHAEWARTGEPA